MSKNNCQNECSGRNEGMGPEVAQEMAKSVVIFIIFLSLSSLSSKN